MKTTITESPWGWKAETRLDFQGRTVIVVTNKCLDRGINTRVLGHEPDDDSLIFLLSDFVKVVREDKTAVCTEESVTTMHEAALADIDGIKAAITAFYLTEESK